MKRRRWGLVELVLLARWGFLSRPRAQVSRCRFSCNAVVAVSLSLKNFAGSEISDIRVQLASTVQRARAAVTLALRGAPGLNV